MNTESPVSRRLVVTGRVQGVGYRVSCAREAQRLGLVGYVHNLADGSVEVIAEGTEAAVAALTEWCRSGPTFARVSNVASSPCDPAGSPGFSIR